MAIKKAESKNVSGCGLASSLRRKVESLKEDNLEPVKEAFDEMYDQLITRIRTDCEEAADNGMTKFEGNYQMIEFLDPDVVATMGNSYELGIRDKVAELFKELENKLSDWLQSEGFEASSDLAVVAGAVAGVVPALLKTREVSEIIRNPQYCFSVSPESADDVENVFTIKLWW